MLQAIPRRLGRATAAPLMFLIHVFFFNLGIREGIGMPQARAANPTGVSPFYVGNKAQLFVDQVLVKNYCGVAFTLHPARLHPENPLIKADKPWEGWRVEIYGSVIYDEEEGIFKMWYLAESPPGYFGCGAPTFYATSRDGIHWQKPLVGTVRSEKVARHNCVVGDAHLASVTKDTADPDPSRRYKMICWDCRRGGYHTKVSPDGLNWTDFSQEPICPGGDVITGYFDPDRKMYVAFAKIGTDVRGHNRRCFYVITSHDFVTWSKPRPAFLPDLRDDAGSFARIEEVRPILDVPDDPKQMRTEFYGIGAYHHESCTLAFPWVFTINAMNRFGSNQEGPSEIQIAVSRDLEEWERPFRVPCIPRGEPGAWDGGWFNTASSALRVGDEIWLYYQGSHYTHGTPALYDRQHPDRARLTSSIGLAIWPLDRFVSVDGQADGGTLTTIPVVFSGDRLELNAATKQHGAITVEIWDAAGKKCIARSEPFSGDELRGKVGWKDGVKIAALAGKPVSLKFHLKNAELYSFAFREPGERR
jgi:hypothetical protein